MADSELTFVWDNRKEQISKTPPKRVLKLWYEFMVLARDEPNPETQWDPEVFAQVAPRPDQTFTAWFEDIVPRYFAQNGGAVGWHGSLERALKRLPKDVLPLPKAAHLEVLTIDRRASGRQILQEMRAYLLERKGRGRPLRKPLVKYLTYAPNGDVDVLALTKALRARQLRDRYGKALTNEQLWNKVVKRLVPQRANTDPDVKRAEVSRHLKRAREVIRAVRQGAFPFDRKREWGLGSNTYKRDGNLFIPTGSIPVEWLDRRG